MEHFSKLHDKIEKVKEGVNQTCTCEGILSYVLSMYRWEMEPTGQRPLLKDILGDKMKIMWEEQLVDPPIAYISSVNVM